MAKIENFEDLEVWKSARILTKKYIWILMITKIMDSKTKYKDVQFPL